ncbi:hypothetical protein [Pectobacterium brasiliense]|uniref:hypothetical protein n=1 Tax=Pectobacterium brasiliense TaxID=180957 RepID=UPI001F07D3DE|nr:hypothetical protein [Pectobacterium brasiliense]
METIKYHGTTICILDDSDMLTDCPLGSYAVIEDSGFYVAVRVGETDAPAIHIDPMPTLEDALDVNQHRYGFNSAIRHSALNAAFDLSALLLWVVGHNMSGHVDH